MLIQTIHKEEISAAYSKGMLTLASMTLEDELKSRYSIQHSICDENCNKYCLYLYLYAMSSWCPDSYNFITEEELINIVNQVEQLHKSCCS